MTYVCAWIYLQFKKQTNDKKELRGQRRESVSFFDINSVILLLEPLNILIISQGHSTFRFFKQLYFCLTSQVRGSV